MPYPDTIETIPERADGPDQKIMAGHMNVIRAALRDMKAMLGDQPQGAASSLQGRINTALDPSGRVLPPAQTLHVAQSGTAFNSIASALASVTDSGASKRYMILVYPGIYSGHIALKDYVDIVSVASHTVVVNGIVTAPQNYPVRATLAFDIDNAAGGAVVCRHAESVLHFYGNIKTEEEGVAAIWGDKGSISMIGDIWTSDCIGVQIKDGNVTVRGHINTNGMAIGVFLPASGSVHVFGTVTCRNSMFIEQGGGSVFVHGDIHVPNENAGIIYDGYLELSDGRLHVGWNHAYGHGITVDGGTFIMRDMIVLCAHADARAVFASSAKNMRCYNTFSNRALHSVITNLIPGGFTHHADVL